MKTYAVLLLSILLLTGCTGHPDEFEQGMQLRTKLLQASSCSFEAQVAADYGDQLHTFKMHCAADPHGDLTFTITEPDTISGISGKLTGEGGSLIFDKTALHFPLMADNQLSPVSAPWVLIKALRSGYIHASCLEDGKIHLSIDDNFEETPLRIDIWLDEENNPHHSDILYDVRRILSVNVENFEIL